MPSRKIITTSIVCLALILSVFLITRENKSIDTSSVISATGIQVDGNPNNDWRNTLVQTINTTETSVLPIYSDEETFDATTITGQVARDVFLKYLEAVRNGEEVTEEKAQEIVDEILATPEYKSLDENLYTGLSIKITNKNDVESIAAYNTKLVSALNNRTMKQVIYPATIVDKYTETEDASVLKQIDPLVLVYQSIVKDLLAMEVPSSAREVHLDLLNSYERMSAVTLAMRNTDTDPIKSFIAVNKYVQYGQELEIALENINLYIQQSLSS